jgi:serine/threonine protein kinase
MSDPPIIALPFTISHYELQSAIGSGAFSTVYRAVDTRLSRPCAIKVIAQSSLPDEAARVHLQREITAMAYLTHPNLVRLEDFITDSRHFYLVMELVVGGTLADFIRTDSKRRERVAADIFFQVVSGILYCHSRGVAHRDLKPQNILMTADRDVKITDFGLCHFESSDSAKTTICGTAAYIAPECLKSHKYDSFAKDIWSLGVILYEIVSGEPPWPTDNPPAMFKQIATAKFTVPTGLSSTGVDLLLKMMRLKPSDRPTAAQILESNWFRLAPARSGMKLSISGPSLCDLAAGLAEGDRPAGAIVSPFRDLSRVRARETGPPDLPRLGLATPKSARGVVHERTSLSPAELAAKRFRGRSVK